MTAKEKEEGAGLVRQEGGSVTGVISPDVMLVQLKYPQ